MRGFLALVLVMIVGCVSGKGSTRLVVSGGEEALGARVIVDGSEFGEMRPSIPSVRDSFAAQGFFTMKSGVHSMRIVMPSGKTMEATLAEGAYVNVWIRSESLQVVVGL